MRHDEALLPGALREILGGIPRMALAFSGGVDSRFLAFAARLAGCEVRLFHAEGPHLAPQDTGFAKFWATKNAFPLERLTYDPLDIPEIARNGHQRCYACKKELLRRIKCRIGESPHQWQFCDGTQADDLLAHRPGQVALSEEGVVSPLALAGMDKAQIRQVASYIGLERPEQKASPCLLTRIAYGLRPQTELLQRLAVCEGQLLDILPAHVEVRLRLTPRPLLQLTEPPGELAPKALKILAENGFGNVEILVGDNISGFFDRR